MTSSIARLEIEEHFNPQQESEFLYVSNRYSNSVEVYKFLKIECKNGGINYATHKEVYEMIYKVLGYPVPK